MRRGSPPAKDARVLTTATGLPPAIAIAVIGDLLCRVREFLRKRGGLQFFWRSCPSRYSPPSCTCPNGEGQCISKCHVIEIPLPKVVDVKKGIHGMYMHEGMKYSYTIMPKKEEEQPISICMETVDFFVADATSTSHTQDLE